MGCGRCLRKCATRIKKIFEKVEYAAVAMCSFGTVMIMIGTAMPRWRLDEHGTKPLENVWSVSGFPSKSYGLMMVYAKSSRSWDVIVRMTCEWQGLKGAQIGGIIQQVWSGDCDGSQQCGHGFTDHVYTRCIEYDRIHTVSLIVLVISLVTIILSLLGVLMAAFGSLKRLGGCAYGFLLLSGFLATASNIVWAVVTHFAFSKLGEDAWYPYPDLAIGWFLHLYGGVTILIAGRIFGWLVMPLVRSFDSEKSALEKRKNKLMMMSWWNR
ncbi:DGK2, partial [Symbiodinium natans]